MSCKHLAWAEGRFGICEWTGDVPRVGEVIRAGGAGQEYRGRWRVVEVEWSIRVAILEPSSAEVKVEPADEVAEEYLASRRAEA